MSEHHGYACGCRKCSPERYLDAEEFQRFRNSDAGRRIAEIAARPQRLRPREFCGDCGVELLDGDPAIAPGYCWSCGEPV